MDSFHIWYKWSLAWEGVSHVITFDLDIYLQGHTFSVAWAGKDWLEVPPTIDKFVMVHLLTNFASQPFLSWPYVGPPQISWWGNDLGFPKPPCMCIIMYDETSLVTPPKVHAHHCDVIFRSSWRQCRRRQGEAFLFVDTWIQVSLAVL